MKECLKKILGIQQSHASQLYKKGISHYNKQEYEKAIPCFEKALDEKTTSRSIEFKLAKFYCSRSNINVGIKYFAIHNNEKALIHFKKALEFNPEDIDLNYFLGICQNNVGDYQGAMASFGKILEIEPWNIPTKLKMAVTFYNLNMWEKAEEIYRAVLEKNPHFADVHYHLGLCLLSQGKTQLAADVFSMALEINPDYIDARLKLGVTQICVNKFDAALENLKTIIQKHPQYADVYYFIGIIKEKTDQKKQALSYFNQALEISPKYKNALVKQILTYYQLGEIQTAEKKLTEALTVYPNDQRLTAIQKSLPVFTTGRQSSLSMENEQIFMELRNEFHKDLDILPSFSEIIKMFSNSRLTKDDPGIPSFLIPFIKEQIKANPHYPDLHHSLGVQLRLLNKLNEAETAFSKALELNPEYIDARINLMKTLFSNKKFNNALEHGQLLAAKNLPFPDVYYTMAQAFLETNRYEEALININRVLKLRPDMPNAFLLKARIYESKGSYSHAVDCLENFIEQGTASTHQLETARHSLEKLQRR
ncbi:MAG: tetratricopeptide repeat protein [Desulfotignum sp.]|nr:tetratricopeptide repeat protein [Desulfotignum sp.]MCF8089759.1 tetratricopeptide repeat protein [Desulfotignum sp.]MCF8138961.1 tetratricopeptide repeat protein [Desulfotignum sp.]